MYLIVVTYASSDVGLVNYAWQFVSHWGPGVTVRTWVRHTIDRH
jgi:hypothetical protein